MKVFGRIKEEHWMNPVDFLIASVGQESTFAIIRILTEAETMKVRTVEIILKKLIEQLLPHAAK